MDEKERKKFLQVCKRHETFMDNHAEQVEQGAFLKVSASYFQEVTWLIEQLKASGWADPPEPKARVRPRSEAAPRGEAVGNESGTQAG